MGKGWDKDKGGKAAWKAWMQEVATECLRVIKPGGHALVWAIPRTSHWTGDAWEDAGWQPREKIYHAFGAGFPKSLNVGKAIDKAAGAKREVVGDYVRLGDKKAYPVNSTSSVEFNNPTTKGFVTAPATPEAAQWEGWGTALKPAVEEWWLFRKPIEGTVANNVLKHGTGAINIDGCRVETQDNRDRIGGGKKGNGRCFGNSSEYDYLSHAAGRFPANLIHDGSDEVLECFPERKVAPSGKPSAGKQQSNNGVVNYGGYHSGLSYSDSGSAARFFKSCPNDDPEDHEASRLFYCGKATKRDRDEGLEGFEEREKKTLNNYVKPSEGRTASKSGSPSRNHHPTVKSTSLMKYLCRMITPPGGIILDPFTGSGSTGKAAILEGFQFVGIEQDAEYLAIARARIKWAENQVNPQPSLEDRVAWLETQVQAQGRKVKKIEQTSQQLSLFNLGG